MSASQPRSLPEPTRALPTSPLEYSVVVLAEDDPQLRRTLSDFLADEGFLVREVSDVAGVEQALAAGSPHALVLDMNLEDGDVSPVLAKLSGVPGRPHTILISASAQAPALAKDHRIELLQKPFDLEALVQALLVPLDERTTEI
jgi:DNA-binding NtrC family response regulator